MSIPLDLIRGRSHPSASSSLGDSIADALSRSHLKTLLDCLASTSAPAIHSPDLARCALLHLEIKAFVRKFALPHAVHRAPLGPSDRVVVALPTGPENALALLAVASYHTCAPVNASCTAAELLDDARRLNARAILTTRDVEDRLELRALGAQLDCDVVFVEPMASGPCGVFNMVVMGELMQVQDAPSRLHGLQDTSLVLHTSGTSGKKKVVPYTLLSLIVGTWAVVESWDLRSTDVNLNMMPLFHVGGIPLFSGGSAIICASFDPIAFWTLAEQRQATWYYAAPTIHHAILASKPDSIVPAQDLSIRMIGNAAGGLLPSLAVDLQTVFQALDRPGCSGVACGPYLSIRDPSNLENAVPADTTGAICVRGLPTFQGYEVSPDIKVPLDTSAFTREGWFDSGDMGYMDSDGYLFITGRSKEIINKGGEVISPFEVEEAILASTKGYATLAFAIEHDVLQETIGIIIVPEPGRPRIGLVRLQDLLREHLHPSKWPVAVVYMDELPQNRAGKPVRLNLACRLGIGRLSDTVPAFHRHFEADVPARQASLSEPIRCNRVTFEVAAIERALLSIRGAFVSTSNLNLEELQESISRVLPGYAIPDPLHVLPTKLPTNPTGEVDFAAMEAEVAERNTSGMSEKVLLLRDIMRNILPTDPRQISADSDFFLLGGNSLLVGKLAHQIRKEIGVNIPVATLFRHRTILLLTLAQLASDANGTVLDAYAGFIYCSRDCETVEYARLLIFRSLFRPDALSAGIVAPVASIIFKWIVIGRFQPGRYRMWSPYYLRYWIVNQGISIAGRGIFSLHPWLEIVYYRLLGARIGRNVKIDTDARLGEFDLLTFGDGCTIDNVSIRGFCVEREGIFTLDKVTIGQHAVINTYTQISPGAVIPDGAVYGPHASSHDAPSPGSFAAYARPMIPEPHPLLKLFVAWPIISSVFFVSYLPWIIFGWLMAKDTYISTEHLNPLESIIKWFATPERILYHILSRAVRALITPLLHLVLGILVKRALGLNQETRSPSQPTQIALLRRYINSYTLSRSILGAAFAILGTHYEDVSIVYRAMGAKIGHRVYWPGSGIFCMDPELLEIGDDVVFGADTEIFTTDCLGTAKVKVANGAMISDRVVLLPGAKIGKLTMMGSGALAMRDTEYKDRSIWLGRECLDHGSGQDVNQDTSTPFGRAFYQGRASYFVFPYFLILAINVTITVLFAIYWSVSAIAAAQVLCRVHLNDNPVTAMEHPSWFRMGAIYSLIAICFVVVLNTQAILAILWVVATKWIIIGRRRDGQYAWDTSSYCQRWQLHLVLSILLDKGYDNGGVLGPLTGTAYFVWYLRAMGARIGTDCALYPGGQVGPMTEPDLVHLGDNVSLDECSVVAHINSRGNFALNGFEIGDGCAMRAGSRLLSGASMEDSSMLCEHTLLASGDVADSGAAYSGWPAKPMEGL
ncbi:acetyl-CoA synthetase-like protein [Mycena vulgaris]|nr:acetyl-CoA synthetase-like protein [Mycena vulgaris]